MRPPNDCIDEMKRKRTVDHQVEALLTGQEVGDEAYAGVSAALGTLDVDRLDIDVDRHAATFAAEAARLVGPTQRPSKIAPRRRPLVPKLATAALAAVLVLGLTGVAAASDASVPGDSLHGIDRALERIGINDGGLPERLAEASELATRGQPVDALNHVTDSLATTSPDAVHALQAVVDKLDSNEAASEDVLADVTGMLEWMSTSDVSGRDFGQEIAERARQIGPAVPPGNAGNGEPQNDNANQNNQGEEPGPGNGNGNSPGNESDRGNGGGPPSETPPGPRGP